MAADLHALGLIAAALGTTALCVYAWRERPTAGMIAILACVPDWRMAGSAVLTLSVSMFLLCSQYVTMVHRDDLTGNPSPRENRRLIVLKGDAARELAALGGTDQTGYPAGWLLAAPFIPAHHPVFESLNDHPYARIEISPLWHSPFTRLWERREHPVALWFTGGRPSEGRLEWRDRPLE